MGLRILRLGKREGAVKIAFCFPGQGSQEVGMGRAVAEAYPEARAVFDEGSEAVGFDLAKLCFEGPIETLGVEPDYVIGHSVGEYSALAAAGAVAGREAVALVRARGEAMAEAARERPGGMAAVIGLDDEVVESLCAEIGQVWPANYNCPGQLVVSGESAAVDRLIEEASKRGARRAVKLRISGAFHSPLVARAADRLRPALARVSWGEPTPPFMSTVTAKLETAQRLGGVLLEQVTAPVRFTQAVHALAKEGAATFVEIGPGSVLSGLLRRCDRSFRTVSVSDPDGVRKLEEMLSAA